MEKRIKFKVYAGGELVGFEQLKNNNWEHVLIRNINSGDSRPNSSVVLTRYEDSSVRRKQFTGLTDCKGEEIYFGDYVRLIDETNSSAIQVDSVLLMAEDSIKYKIVGDLYGDL